MSTVAVPGLDITRVEDFVSRALPGARGKLEGSLFGAGRSNLTYLLSAGNWRCVLRRPPLGHVLPTAHDMKREFRILSALHPAGYPVPRPIVYCSDTSVTGAPFYLMDYVDGVVVEESYPAGYLDDPADRHRFALAVVNSLARLHALDPASVGLQDFGRPEGFIQRQVRRWAQQWEQSKTRDLPEFDEVHKRLAASIPLSPAPAIVHGDYRLGNMLHDPRDPGRVAAVVDWEMSTLGDPLFDLAYFLMHWTDPGDSEPRIAQAAAGELTLLPGFPRRAELLAEYARVSGRAVENLAFYEALSFFKHAVITEGIYTRYVAGETVGVQQSEQGSRLLLELALAASERSEDPRLRGAA